MRRQNPGAEQDRQRNRAEADHAANEERQKIDQKQPGDGGGRQVGEGRDAEDQGVRRRADRLPRAKASPAPATRGSSRRRYSKRRLRNPRPVPAGTGRGSRPTSMAGREPGPKDREAGGG